MKILVGIDGSDASMNAAIYAVKMAKRLGAEVIAVSVINESAYKEFYADISEKIKAETERFLSTAKEIFAEQGINIITQIAYGVPDEVLAERAVQDKDIAMLVVGASGKGRVARIFAGSQTHALINRVAAGLPCAVVVVTGNNQEFLQRM
jgi:nucleotide-binding universal stress UspA family protein